MEAWAAVRHLHAQGHSVRRISRELHLSRQTVRRALGSPEPPRYQRKPIENQQLAKFVALIQHLTTKQKLIGSRILKEIRARGYRGSAAAFYRLWTTLRPTQPDPRITERFETAPGEQMQFDWSPYTVVLGGARTRLVMFGSVLGYSRRLFYWPSLDETQASVYEAFEEGFWYYGGVTKCVLVDNAGALVIDPRPLSFQWHPQFLALCGYYRVEPRACRPRRARTKGKRERPFRDLEEHFIKGNTWLDFMHLCRDLVQFTRDTDGRKHRTTQQPPIERFAEEVPTLTPLPATRYVGIHALTRKVSWDCLVSYEGSRYSTPWVHAGQRIWVRASQGVRLEVMAPTGAVIARHTLSRTKGATIIDPAHYEGLRKDTPHTKVVLAEAFQQRFPDARVFLDGVLAQQKMNPVRHLRGILELAQHYPDEAMRVAFQSACTYNTFTVQFLRGVLQYTAQPALVPSTPLGTLRAVPRVSIKRDLRVYQSLLTAPAKEVLQ